MIPLLTICPYTQGDRHKNALSSIACDYKKLFKKPGNSLNYDQ